MYFCDELPDCGALRIEVLMERQRMQDLERWKESPRRKPLVLRGARQVGKTWLLKEFGRRHYRNLAYFNFDERPELKQFFELTKEPGRILRNLSLDQGQMIDLEHPDSSLIVFDEIQECPEALGSLKYFQENAPEIHILSAGSLLGGSLAKPGAYPVGKLDFLDLWPMSFTEFLEAIGQGKYASYLAQIDKIEPIPDAFFSPLSEFLRLYWSTGGMPEAVWTWTQENSLEIVETVLGNILIAYQGNLAKHPVPKDIPKTLAIWQSIPSQLSRENRKFFYTQVKDGAREYQDALGWLLGAGLCHKVQRVSRPGVPLSVYDEAGAFKLYGLDLGLLRKQAGLEAKQIWSPSPSFVEFKGGFSENYVLQSLLPQLESAPRYWASNNPSYEIDFLIQVMGQVFPVEVKWGQNLRSKSLKAYREKFGGREGLSLRFSQQNLRLDGDILNIPLFLADQSTKLLELAIAHRAARGRTGQ